MAGLFVISWWEWLMAVLVIVWDALSQRIYSVTLPPCIPIESLSHLTCVITSCDPGIALETAKHLVESGAHVIFAVTNPDAVRELIAAWEGGQNDGLFPLNCEVMEMDCLSLDSVRKFAVNWEARGLPLNVLINVADNSCFAGSERFSKDGFEHHMQVNHLAPALLTLLLLPSLLRGSPSRVVMVNSVAHHIGNLDAENLDLSGTKKKYKLTSFANSKLAQLLFSNLLQRRLPKEASVDVICVHPGQVTRAMVPGSRGITRLAQRTAFFLLSPVEGARSVLFCAKDKQVQDYARALRGLNYPLAPYFGSDCKPCSVARQVHDMDKANLVWQETLRLLEFPVEGVEVAVSESDPADAAAGYVESFPTVGNGEDLDFLLENGNDDVDDFFSGPPGNNSFSRRGRHDEAVSVVITLSDLRVIKFNSKIIALSFEINTIGSLHHTKQSFKVHYFTFRMRRNEPRTGKVLQDEKLGDWQNISFDRRVTKSSLAVLTVPAKFVRKHGDKFQKLITVQSEVDGRLWTVEVSVNFPHGRPQVGFSSGWKKFVVFNGLVQGDWVTFNLVAKSKFKVSIARSSENSNAQPRLVVQTLETSPRDDSQRRSKTLLHNPREDSQSLIEKLLQSLEDDLHRRPKKLLRPPCFVDLTEGPEVRCGDCNKPIAKDCEAVRADNIAPSIPNAAAAAPAAPGAGSSLSGSSAMDSHYFEPVQATAQLPFFRS